MKKNGFTLVELMGVILLLGLVFIVSYTVITNEINKGKTKISDATLKIIYNATDEYLEDNDNYDKTPGNSYCVNVSDLISNNYFDEKIIDQEKNLNVTKIVKIIIGNSNKMDYEIVDSCNTVTVTFDANGGVVDVITKDVLYKGSYGTLPIPTKEGFTFEGWYIDASTSGQKITPLTINNSSINHTLYAKWVLN